MVENDKIQCMDSDYAQTTATPPRIIGNSHVSLSLSPLLISNVSLATRFSVYYDSEIALTIHVFLPLSFMHFSLLRHSSPAGTRDIRFSYPPPGVLYVVPYSYSYVPVRAHTRIRTLSRSPLKPAAQQRRSPPTFHPVPSPCFRRVEHPERPCRVRSAWRLAHVVLDPLRLTDL